MKSAIQRGEKFYLQGKPWACLDIRGKQLLAIHFETYETRVLSSKSVRYRVGKRYVKLVEAIDHLLEHLPSEKRIQTDLGKFTNYKSISVRKG